MLVPSRANSHRHNFAPAPPDPQAKFYFTLHYCTVCGRKLHCIAVHFVVRSSVRLCIFQLPSREKFNAHSLLISSLEATLLSKYALWLLEKLKGIVGWKIRRKVSRVRDGESKDECRSVGRK